MARMEVTQETLSRLDYQLKSATANDPTGLVRQFLIATNGVLPTTNYDNIYQFFKGTVHSRDGKFELEITNASYSQNAYGATEASAAIIKFDRDGKRMAKVQLDCQGYVSITYRYYPNETEIITFVEGGHGKVASIERVTINSDCTTNSVYTDYKSGQRPMFRHDKPPAFLPVFSAGR